MVISDYYNSLDDTGKKLFRNKVIEALEISLPTFYYKLRKGSWRKIEIQVITQFTNEVLSYA